MMELDDFTKKHLEAWLERTVRRGDKAKVRASIMRLLKSDPDLLNGRSWPELRDLAERQPNPMKKYSRRRRRRNGSHGRSTRAGSYSKMLMTRGVKRRKATRKAWKKKRSHRALRRNPRGQYKARSAREAQAAGYGDKGYWDYLDKNAQEHFKYYMKKGQKKKAKSMLTESLSESLRGNEGD